MHCAACATWPRRNAGCTYLSTRTCLVGWPAHHADPAVLAYYRLELARYLHMLLKVCSSCTPSSRLRRPPALPRPASRVWAGPCKHATIPSLCCLPLLQPVFRYGLRDGRDMVVHHCASLALILTSYGACRGCCPAPALWVHCTTCPAVAGSTLCAFDAALQIRALLLGGDQRHFCMQIQSLCDLV